MKIRWFRWWLLWLVSAVALAAAGVREGMTRQEVVAALGDPVSTLSVGERTIMNYPGDGRVELRAGLVISAVRVPRHDDVVLAQEPPPPAAEPVIEAAAPAAPKIPAPATEPELATEIDSFWTELLVALLAQTATGWVVLKLAFRWEDLQASWLELLLPAFVAAATGAVTRGVAWSLWQSTELFRLDDALSFGALIIGLLKLTNACTLSRAAGVAVAAKLMTIVVWSVLSVALTRLVFS